MVSGSQSLLVHQADPVAAPGPDKSLEKHSRVRSVEKPADEEPSGQRFVAWVVRVAFFVHWVQGYFW